MKITGYIVIILLIVSVLAIDMHFSSTYEEYSMYNSNWNGTSLFVADALDSGAKFVEDYRELKEITNSTLIIIEPEGDFTADELREIRDFRDSGNIIFVTDETGSSDILMKIINQEISVEKANLSSIDIEYRNPRFIICYPQADDRLTEGVESIVLNKPSVASGGETIIGTSFISWTDDNGNGMADSMESLGKRAVLVRSKDTYLLSDSGIFQNALYRDERLRDNRQFIGNIMSSSENIYIEKNHSQIAAGGGVLGIINYIRGSEPVKAAAIIIIILLLLFIYRGKYD